METQAYKSILVLYCSGFEGLSSDNEFTSQNIYNFCYNHQGLCDKKATDSLAKENVLVTPLTKFDTVLQYSVLDLSALMTGETERHLVIGQAIAEKYYDYDSFVVIHEINKIIGISTKVSFALENLGKSVIFTTSKMNIKSMRSDAPYNLVDSLIVAGHYVIPEVCILFNSALMRAVTTSRAYEDTISPFRSMWQVPLLKLSISIEVEWDQILKTPTEDFIFIKSLKNTVSNLKLYPSLSDKTLKEFFKSSKNLVVLETEANRPPSLQNSVLKKAITDAISAGKTVVFASQKLFSAKAREEGILKDLTEIGVICTELQTPETVTAKMMFLAAKQVNTTQIAARMQESIRGEVFTRKKEVFSMHSDKVFDELFKVFNHGDKSEEDYVLVSALLPTLVLELVKKVCF